MSTKELFERAKRRFKQASEAEAKQRGRERDALRFQMPGNQWTDEAKRERLGTAAQGVPTPPRPMLSVDKIAPATRLITNQERNAKLGISLHPLTPDANDDTAAVLQDLYRTIERESMAGQARSWAFDRSTKAGKGWWEVTTEYDPNSDPATGDQVIRINRILYQDSVYVDPSATKMDFSDARYMFREAWVPASTFREMYPDAEVSELTEFVKDDVDPSWVSLESDEDGRNLALAGVRVIQYWYKEYEYEDVKVGKGTRKVERCKVFVCKFNGDQILEEPQEWNGRLIPLIPAIGREIQPFDGERIWEGIIGPNMDAQRAYNYALTGAVEGAALEPKAPFVADPRQIEGYEQFWQQANTRNLTVLPVNTLVVQGQVIPPPARMQVDGSRMQINLALAQSMEGALQSGTAMFDPSLGRPTGNEKSGKAILALQEQGNSGSSDFLANLADISLQYEARVILDLIPSIYDRPGRIARILDEEDKTRPVMLNTPFMVDKETGQVTGLPDADPANLPPGAKYFDLTKGRYAVSVSIGRSRQTRMQEGAEEIGQILSSHPELVPILGPTYFQFRDFPGARELADLLRKMRDKQFPFLAGDEEQGPSAEQLQAQVEQMGQQMQAMQQALQQAQQEIQTDQAKQTATLQKAQMDNATKERIAGLEARTRETIALMQAQGEAAERRQDAILEAIKLMKEDASEKAGRTHEKAMGEAGAAAVEFPKTFAGSVGLPLEADRGEV